MTPLAWAWWTARAVSLSRARRSRGELPTRGVGGEGLALDELHREEGDGLAHAVDRGRAGLVDLPDARVAEHAEHLGLAIEASGGGAADEPRA